MTPTMGRWVRAAGLDALELRLQARHTTWLWVILAVAFVARTVVAAVFTDLDPATANLWEYGEIARTTLQHGDGQMVWQIGVHGVPGHPAGTTFVFPTAFEPPFLIF